MQECPVVPSKGKYTGDLSRFWNSRVDTRTQNATLKGYQERKEMFQGIQPKNIWYNDLD